MAANLIGSIIIIWSFLHSFSYGIWTWKRKNRVGAFMIFLLSALSIAVPVFLVFFRQE